jgi:hypothetical protein
MGNTVQAPRRGEVAAERLLDDDARVRSQTRIAELRDDIAEEQRWDGKVVRWARSCAEHIFQPCKRVSILVITIDVSQSAQEAIERRAVVDATIGVLEAVFCPRLQLLQGPT